MKILALEDISPEAAEWKRLKWSRTKSRTVDYLQTQRARGLESVTVWVPADKVQEFREFARRLRVEAGAPLLMDER